MIDPDVVRSAATPLQARARSFARHVITPTVVAAAEMYPELSVTEILARCEPTLIPSPIDQNRCAHWRNPRDMMRHG